MSKTDHWMPLYIGDYLADTMHLSGPEHGAYLLMLMHHWRHGSIPDDDAQIARIVFMDQADWVVISLSVRAFFKVKNGRLFQKRTLVELARVEKIAKKRRKSGQKGGKAKAEKTQQCQVDTSKCQEFASVLPDTSTSTAIKIEEKEAPLVTPPQAKPKAARGTRLSTDWDPSPADYDFALGLGLAPIPIANAFRDYWIAKAGANGTKLDWPATWRNWCRREAERKPKPRQEFRNGFLEIIRREQAGEPQIEADNAVTDFLRLPHVH